MIRGMASCVTSALWPERVTGRVSYAGYDIVDAERLRHAFAPALEHVQWYQHLFQLERGRGCLASGVVPRPLGAVVAQREVRRLHLREDGFLL